mmetsp:Transcript_31458/g.105907  ORF Transcript_31458/g.105907 Transcript_31458/m.105907 type:complete len:225 (+) Transcript_31458:814-1488(+)
MAARRRSVTSAVASAAAAATPAPALPAMSKPSVYSTSSDVEEMGAIKRLRLILPPRMRTRTSSTSVRPAKVRFKAWTAATSERNSDKDVRVWNTTLASTSATACSTPGGGSVSESVGACVGDSVGARDGRGVVMSSAAGGLHVGRGVGLSPRVNDGAGPRGMPGGKVPGVGGGELRVSGGASLPGSGQSKLCLLPQPFSAHAVPANAPSKPWTIGEKHHLLFES